MSLLLLSASLEVVVQVKKQECGKVNGADETDNDWEPVFVEALYVRHRDAEGPNQHHNRVDDTIFGRRLSGERHLLDFGRLKARYIGLQVAMLHFGHENGLIQELLLYPNSTQFVDN